MKTKKILILSALAVLGLVSCGNKSSTSGSISEKSSDSSSVVTSESEQETAPSEESSSESISEETKPVLDHISLVSNADTLDELEIGSKYTFSILLYDADEGSIDGTEASYSLVVTEGSDYVTLESSQTDNSVFYVTPLDVGSGETFSLKASVTLNGVTKEFLGSYMIEEVSPVPEKFYNTNWVPYDISEHKYYFRVYFDDKGFFTVFVGDNEGETIYSVKNVEVTGSDPTYTISFTIVDGKGNCGTLCDDCDCTITSGVEDNIEYLKFVEPSLPEPYFLVLDA